MFNEIKECFFFIFHDKKLLQIDQNNWFVNNLKGAFYIHGLVFQKSHTSRVYYYRPPGGIWNLNAFHQQGHNSNFFHHAQPPSAAPWRPPFRPDYFQRFGRHPQPFFIPPPPRPLRRRSGGSGGSDGSCVGVVKTTPRIISSAESSAQAKPASPSSLTKDQTKTSATATGNPQYRLSSSGNGVLNAAPTTSDCRKSATPPSPSRVNKRAKNGKRKNIAANFDNL